MCPMLFVVTVTIITMRLFYLMVLTHCTPETRTHARTHTQTNAHRQTQQDTIRTHNHTLTHTHTHTHTHTLPQATPSMTTDGTLQHQLASVSYQSRPIGFVWRPG